MRIYAISDLHCDYAANVAWVRNLSLSEFQDDVLILAGDVSNRMSCLAETFTALARRFGHILFVPGNHELWVAGDEVRRDSFDKFHVVRELAEAHGVSTGPYKTGSVAIVPLLGWYDGSFGKPSPALREAWADFYACVWPELADDGAVTTRFLSMNEPLPTFQVSTIISFSHFVPRLDLLPNSVDERDRMLWPVLGSSLIDYQVRRLGAHLHIYGHSHVNQRRIVDGVTYVNNALGYPQEGNIAARRLLQIFETVR